MDLRARFLGHLEAVREPLTAYVRGLLWNPSDLPDALQSAFLTAFGKFAQFQEGTDFHAWVFRIATLTVFSMNRKTEPSLATPEEVPAEVEIDREFAYDEILHDPERVLEHFDDEVRRSLLSLPENERAAFLLVIVGGFKYREAAEILEIPIGSVMGYAGRARRKIRERLAEFARGRTP